MADEPATAQTQTQTSGTGDGSGPIAGYSPHEHRPLASYAVLSATFGSAFAGALVASERSGRKLPEAFSTRDVILVGLATHKLSRVIAKDKVTAYIRAPFVRYQGPAGPAEVSEEVRGTGLRMAVGELLNCPYCLGQWVAGSFSVGLIAAPRVTRLIASMLAAQTLSDFLQLGYAAAEERA